MNYTFSNRDLVKLQYILVMKYSIINKNNAIKEYPMTKNISQSVGK